MGDDPDTERTRRGFVRGGVALAAGTVLAGCAGGSGTDSTKTDGDGTAAPTDRETGTATSRPAGTDPETTTADEQSETPTATAEGAAYTAEIAPAGEVRFEEPPESIFTILSSHADMALALGRGDDVNAVYAVEYTNSLMNAFVPRLDGVSADWSDLYSSWNPSREKVFELDSDIHLADPANVLTMGNWEQSDIQDVAEQVGPWFGNTFSAQHGDPPEAYADDYRYYTLWETFGRVADALDERARYEALAEVRADLVSTIESELPSESERPSVAMVLNSTAGDGMWTYDVTAEGYHSSHTRPLGAVNAFADVDDVSNGAKIDYEALAEADPDVILTLGGVVDAHDMAAIRETLADDPVASQVTAVDEGRVYAQGTRHQGPLINLFQLEMGAKQLYPEAFGEWPTYREGPYPDLDTDEQLFDHQRVADIITEQP